MPDVVYAWTPINKVEGNDDGSLTVYGIMANASPDRDRQKFDQAWLDAAVPRWYHESGNVREMHGPSAVGTAVGLVRQDDGGYLLAARIVDPTAIKKCQPGPNGERAVYQGFSVGVKEPHLTYGKADAPNGVIDGGYICETSLADRPANPTTLFTLVKADVAGEFVDVGREYGDGLFKFVSAAQRDQYADQGVAMPNGDFPIPDRGHLLAALGRLKGYKGDKAAARAHIKKRAKALGVPVPSLDGDDAQKMLVAALVPGVDLAELAKYDEQADIDGAQAAIAQIAALIQSEAAELAAGRLEELEDIRVLCAAADGLKYFICREQGQAQMGNDGDTGGGWDGYDQDDLMLNGAVTTMAKTDGTTTGDGTGAPAPEYLSKADAAAMIDEAVAKATEAQKAEISSLQGQLAKVLQAPAPGGPVQTRTAAQTAGARTHDVNQVRQTINAYLSKADELRAEDPELARGYREQAEKLKSSLPRD